ncbi:MAG: WYL domain-containing protein [Deltaproteobacteria bacterium]|jgi:predicted DNA-binding transcriptional regulator YafY|nr:WYL domain-containing protein [Deltaproteobacteria bacterium]
MATARGDLTKSEKCLKIVNDLLYTLNFKTMSLQTASKRLECSRDTAKRVLEEVAYNLPDLCHFEESRNELIKLKVENNQQDELIAHRNLFKHIEPQDLALAKSVIDMNRNLLGDKVSEALLETIDHFDTENRIGPPAPVYRLKSKEFIDYGPHRDVLRSSIEAIRQKKVCEIFYVNKAHKEKKYLFAPRDIRIFRDKIYIQGFLSHKVRYNKLDDPQERSLQLNKIMKITLTNRSISDELIPSEHSYLYQGEKSYALKHQEDQPQELFGFMDEKPFDLTFIFDPSESYLKDYNWPNGAKPELNNGYHIRRLRNWYRLSIRCGSERETLNWLLGFGSKVRILKPLRLINRYRAELREMAVSNDMEIVDRR